MIQLSLSHACLWCFVIMRKVFNNALHTNCVPVLSGHLLCLHILQCIPNMCIIFLAKFQASLHVGFSNCIDRQQFYWQPFFWFIDRPLYSTQ